MKKINQLENDRDEEVIEWSGEEVATVAAHR